MAVPRSPRVVARKRHTTRLSRRTSFVLPPALNVGDVDLPEYQRLLLLMRIPRYRSQHPPIAFGNTREFEDSCTVNISIPGVLVARIWILFERPRETVSLNYTTPLF